MPLPKFHEVLADPAFQTATVDRQSEINKAYWNAYDKENPGDEWGKQQRDDTSRALQAKALSADAAPITKRGLDIERASANARVRLRNMDAAGEFKTPEERQAAVDAAQLAEKESRASLQKTASLFTPEVEQQMQPAWKSLEKAAANGQYFDEQGTGTKLYNAAADLLPGGQSYDKTQESRKFYEEQRNKLAEDFNLQPAEVDDLVRHRMGKQKDSISRDAAGSIHIKDELLVKPVDQLSQAIESSNLSPSTKKQALVEAPFKVAQFKEGVVQNVQKNHPELASEVKWTGNVSDDYVSITKLLNDSATEQAVGGAAGYGLGRAATFAGRQQTEMGDFVPAEQMSPQDARAGAQKLQKRQEAINQLSLQINQDKVKILGTDAATVGSGVASMAESMVVAGLTGGVGNALISAERIAKAGKVGATLLKFGQGAANIAPTAGIYGVDQGLSTYEQAMASDDPKIRARAGELALKSGFIEAGVTTVFGGVGAGGAETMAQRLVSGASRREAAVSLKRAWFNLGKNLVEVPLQEIPEETLITALDAVHVQKQLNPGMTDADVKKAVYDTMVSTLISTAPMGVFNVAKEAKKDFSKKTHEQTDTELHDVSDSIYENAAKENVPEAPTATGALKAGSTATVADIERTRSEQIALTEDPEEKAALQEATPEELAGEWGVDLEPNRNEQDQQNTGGEQNAAQTLQLPKVPVEPETPTDAGTDSSTPEGTRITETEVQAEIEANKPIQAIHYSREPLKLEKGKDIGSIEGRYEEESILGEGFYAMEPQDEDMWKNASRFELGENRNDVTVTPKNPIVITPKNASKISVDGIKESVKSGMADAVIVRGFPENFGEGINERVDELWTPKFPEGKTSGKFTNGVEYEVALTQAIKEITGLTLEKFEELQKAGLFMNQIFVPKDSAPEIVTTSNETPNQDSAPEIADPAGEGMVAPVQSTDTLKPIELELRDTAVMIRDEDGEPSGERPAKSFTATDPGTDSRAIGTLDGEKLQVTDIRTKKAGEKTTGTRFFERLVRAGQANGASVVEVKLQSADTRAVLNRLVEKGVLTNPRQIAGDSMDRHPTLFDIAQAPAPTVEPTAENALAEIARLVAVVPEGIAPATAQPAAAPKLVQGTLFQKEEKGDPNAINLVRSYKGSPPKGATRALIDYAGEPLLSDLGDLPAHTVRDIKEADQIIQETTGKNGKAKLGRVGLNAFLSKLWKRHHRGKSPGWHNFQGRRDIREMGKILSFEIAHALSKDGSGVDWYRAKIDGMYEELALDYPELAKDGEERFLFSVMLAVTSNGQPVLENLKDTIALYERMRGTNRLPKDAKTSRSERGAAVQKAFREINALLDENSWQDVKKELLTPITVSELKKKYGQQITGELADHTVIGAMILGPKIGSFWGNLNGHYDSVTMDLWFTRTMNRLSGDTATINPEGLAANLKTLGEIPGLPVDVYKDIKKYVKDLENSEKSWVRVPSDIREELEHLYGFVKKTYGQYASSGFTDRSDFNKTVQKIVKEIDGGEDTPDNGTHRKWMRTVVEAAQSELQKAGVKLTNADLQAILWFHEKDLYTRFGATTNRGERTDYQQAAAKLSGKAGSKTQRASGPGGREDAGAAGPARSGEQLRLFQNEERNKGYYQPGVRGAAQATIGFFGSADASTGVHEYWHDLAENDFFGILTPEEVKIIRDWETDGTGNRDTTAKEKGARGWERFLFEGTSTGFAEVDAVLSKLSEWLRSIYQGIQGSSLNVDISPEVRAIMEKLVTRAARGEKVVVTPTKVVREAPAPAKPKPAEAKPKKKIPKLRSMPSSTSIKNAETDKILSAAGLPEIMAPARKANEESWDEAMRVVSSDPRAGSRVVSGIINSGRSVNNEVEEGVLLHETAIRKADVVRARALLAKNPGDPGLIAELKEAQAALYEVVVADKLAGTAWGRIGQFRQRSIKEDFTLEAMEARFRADVNEGAPLSGADSKYVAELQKRITEAEEKTRKMEEQFGQKAREADALLKKLEEKRAAVRAPSREGFVDRVKEKATAARAVLGRFARRETLMQRGEKTGPTTTISVGGATPMKVLLSKNTIPGEKPYRATWFLDNGDPAGHTDLSQEEYNSALRGQKVDLADGKFKATLNSEVDEKIPVQYFVYLTTQKRSFWSEEEALASAKRNGRDKIEIVYSDGSSELKSTSVESNADTEYLAAISRGDMDTAKRLVDAERKKLVLQDAVKFPFADETLGVRRRGSEGHGAWLLPGGSLILVPDNHARTALKYFPNRKGTLESSQSEAFGAGWVLIRVHPKGTYRSDTENVLTVAGKELSKDQKRNVTDWSLLHDYKVDEDLAPHYGRYTPTIIERDFDKNVIPLSQRFLQQSERLYQSASNELTPDELEAFAAVGAEYLANGARTLDQFTAKLTEEFPGAEAFAEQIFNEAQRSFKSTASSSRAKTPAELKNLLDKENPQISNKLIYNMARGFINQGLEGREVLDAVTKLLNEDFPDLTREEVVEAFTGYGKVKYPSKEEDLVKLRELRNIERIQRQIDDVRQGLTPKKTGQQRDAATLKIRELKKELQEAMRAMGIKHAVNKNQLRGALDAIKSRYKNEIEELEESIRTKTKRKERRSTLEYDDEIKALKAKRDKLKADYDNTFGVSRKAITEQQRVKAAVKSLTKRIAEEEAMLKAGILERVKAGSRTTLTPEIIALRTKLDALRAAREKAREALHPKRTPEERALARALSAAQKSIDRYNAVLSGTSVPGKAPSPLTPNSALNALWSQRNALRKAVEQLRKASRPRLSADEKARRQAVAQLDKSIKEIERRIATGDFSIKPKSAGRAAGFPDVVALKAQRDSLQATFDALKKAALPGLTPEEKKDNALVRAANSRRAKIEARIAAGDYVKVERVTPVMSAKVAAARLAEAKAKEEWNRGFFEAELKKRSLGKKSYDTAVEILNFSRTMKTIADVSAVLRQGLVTMVTHPFLSLRAVPDMFRAGFSEVQMQRIKDGIENHPRYALSQQAKLFIADTGPDTTVAKIEEAFRGRWAKQIPGLKAVVNFSERTYNAYLNSVRIAHFNSLVEAVGGKPSVKEAKILADFVNKATGRGDLRSMESAAAGLAAVFFSPKFVVSRFQLIWGAVPVVYDVATGFQLRNADVRKARKAIAKEYVRFIVGAAAIYGLVALAKAGYGDDDDEIETDPRSSNFGKIKLGNTYIDPMGGLLQAAVFSTRMILGETKTQKGEVQDLHMASFGKQSYLGVLGSFLRSKLSPVPSAYLNVRQGADVIGSPSTVESEFIGSVIPLAFGDVFETMRENGVAKGTPLAVLGLLGLGVQSRSEELSLEQYLATLAGSDPVKYSRKQKAASKSGKLPSLKL